MLQQLILKSIMMPLINLWLPQYTMIDETDDLTKNDSDLFRRIVSSDKKFQPLKDNNKKYYPAKINKHNKLDAIRPNTQTAPEVETHHVPLSENLWRPIVLSNEYISYFKPGIQPRTIKQLQTGKILIEATLDLHEKNKTQAAYFFSRFITSSYKRQLRCLCIIHGKGLGSESNQPILKNLVNHWLYEFEEVLGFCSCPPFLGGTGAILVLLKKA